MSINAEETQVQIKICDHKLGTAIKAFAARVKDRPDTPCLRVMDSSSRRLRRDESISLTEEVSGVEILK